MARWAEGPILATSKLSGNVQTSRPFGPQRTALNTQSDPPVARWATRRYAEKLFRPSSRLRLAGNSWHGVPMKLVGMLRKLGRSSCVKAKEQSLLNGLAIDEPAGGTSAFNSRATFAEATAASATAAGSLAVLAIGGLAVGFLVIGRLIIREMLIQQVHLRRLKIDQLEVEDLRVSKLTVLDEQRRK
jgi:hypothetical protein